MTLAVIVILVHGELFVDSHCAHSVTWLYIGLAVETRDFQKLETLL